MRPLTIEGSSRLTGSRPPGDRSRLVDVRSATASLMVADRCVGSIRGVEAPLDTDSSPRRKSSEERASGCIARTGKEDGPGRCVCVSVVRLRGLVWLSENRGEEGSEAWVPISECRTGGFAGGSSAIASSLGCLLFRTLAIIWSASWSHTDLSSARLMGLSEASAVAVWAGVLDRAPDPGKPGGLEVALVQVECWFEA
eukprot:3911074-Rhodomonas_salina.2